MLNLTSSAIGPVGACLASEIASLAWPLQLNNPGKETKGFTAYNVQHIKAQQTSNQDLISRAGFVIVLDRTRVFSPLNLMESR